MSYAPEDPMSPKQQDREGNESSSQTLTNFDNSSNHSSHLVSAQKDHEHNDNDLDHDNSPDQPSPPEDPMDPNPHQHQHQHSHSPSDSDWEHNEEHRSLEKHTSRKVTDIENIETGSTHSHSSRLVTVQHETSRSSHAHHHHHEQHHDHHKPEPRRVTSSQTIRHTRARLGLRPAAPINEEEQFAERQGLRWSRVRVALREPFSEFWGVVVMVVLGNASVAQVLLSEGQKDAPGGSGYGGWQSINWGWGVGVMLGLYVAGDSGAYLNPAITFSNCLFRQLPWRRFPTYAVAQLLGSFVGSGIVYANYINAIDQYEGKGIRSVPPNPKATATIFCTFPQPFLTKASQFFSEFIASAVLVLVIFALRDPGNNGIEKDGKWFPLMMLFLIFALGTGFGWNTGYAINPARDLGPRIMATILGYGSQMWSAGGYYFWIPIVAPFCGCVFGGLLYDVFIYTGASPINTPWMGLKHIFRPDYTWKVARERHHRGIEEGIV